MSAPQIRGMRNRPRTARRLESRIEPDRYNVRLITNPLYRAWGVAGFVDNGEPVGSYEIDTETQCQGAFEELRALIGHRSERFSTEPEHRA